MGLIQWRCFGRVRAESVDARPVAMQRMASISAIISRSGYRVTAELSCKMRCDNCAPLIGLGTISTLG